MDVKLRPLLTSKNVFHFTVALGKDGGREHLMQSFSVFLTICRHIARINSGRGGYINAIAILSPWDTGPRV